MLIKLLKYDLKYMLKNMIIFYTLTILFALLTRVFTLFNQTTFIIICKSVCIGAMLSMVFSTLINTIIRSWVRFKVSLYGEESYLYHTLPVTRKQLYNSKFLESIIFTFVGFIIVVISLLIAFASKDNFDLIKNSIDSISSTLNINLTSFLLACSLMIFIEMTSAIQTGFIGIILGNRYQERKVLKSFGFGILFYLLSQLIVVIMVLIVGLFNPNIMKIFTDNVLLNNQVITLLVITCLLTYLLIIFISNIIATKILNNKVNVE